LQFALEKGFDSFSPENSPAALAGLTVYVARVPAAPFSFYFSFSTFCLSMMQRSNENLLMKTRFHLLAATTAFVIASIAFIGEVSSAWAQDPAVVNAKTIKVKFENERVRVLEAELSPGVKEQVHSHPAYVIYVLAGGKYRNYAADGKTTEGELKTGEVLYRDPLTHAAENIGNTTMHMILVELKTPASR
jgi:quercetin dioxygenase-like cupin family protein